MFERLSDRYGLELEDYLLLAAALGLPWFFGGVRIEAFRGAAFLLVGAAAVALARRGLAGLSLNRHGALWLMPAFLLAMWGAFQLVPLPSETLEALSPRAHQIYQDALLIDVEFGPGEYLAAHDDLALAAVPEIASVAPAPASSAMERDVVLPGCLSAERRTLSLLPSATEERVFWYIALLLGFLVLQDRLRDPDRFYAYRACFLVFFGVLAAFALVQDLTADGEIYWSKRLDTDLKPFGPYVNPVHFGGVMELGVPALAGYALGLFRNMGRSALYRGPFALASIATGVCLVATVAASGKMAILLVCACLLVLSLATARTRRTRLVILAAAVLLVVVIAGVVSTTALGERFGSYFDRETRETFLEGRAAVWGTSLGMAGDFLWTGAGFGSFSEIHPQYLPPGATARWSYAHNDYLQLLVEGGVVAVALFLWLVAVYVLRAGRSIRLRGWSLPQMGMALGVASLAVHAGLDFNHQIPANALLFVCFAALSLHGEAADGSEVDG